MEHVTVLEYWTWEGGYRKIADGLGIRIQPWGFVPFVQIKPCNINEWATETWVTPREAQLLLNA
jgi:hypothetical protein